MNAGTIPLRKVIDYARQIVNGLSAAHEKGIIHRDLKPENLFITKDDRVKILDFGLAKLRGSNESLGSEDATRKAITNPGVVMGGEVYLAEETQLKAAPSRSTPKMRRCPTCNRLETDDALGFCRADGTALISDSSPRNSEAGTAPFGSASAANEIETSILPHTTAAGMDRPTAPTTALSGQPAPS